MPAKKKDAQPRQTVTKESAELDYQAVREKAHAWLVDHADRLEALLDQEDLSREDELKIFDSQEALVYLESRKHDCSRQKEKLIRFWRTLEQKAFWSSKDVANWRARGTLKNVPFVPGRPRLIPVEHSERTEILKRCPANWVREFWLTLDQGDDEDVPQADFLLDACMRRTADWCGIRGFEDWWARLKKWDTRKEFLSRPDDFHPYEWLFRMVRSEWARDRALKILKRTLEIVEAPSECNLPWEFWRLERDGRQYVVSSHDWASTVLFANAMLRRDRRNEELMDSAEQLLLNSQNSVGYWTSFSYLTKPSIKATAMAVHALSLSKPCGGADSARLACDWLLGAQDQAGCWGSKGADDAAFLTLLVLDALDLGINGELAKPTFLGPRRMGAAKELRPKLLVDDEGVDPVADALAGQPLKLYTFLRRRKHWTAFPTLADQTGLWRTSDPSVATIDKALRRLQGELNGIDRAPRLMIDRRADPHRTKLDKE